MGILTEIEDVPSALIKIGIDLASEQQDRREGGDEF